MFPWSPVRLPLAASDWLLHNHLWCLQSFYFFAFLLLDNIITYSFRSHTIESIYDRITLTSALATTTGTSTSTTWSNFAFTCTYCSPSCHAKLRCVEWFHRFGGYVLLAFFIRIIFSNYRLSSSVHSTYGVKFYVWKNYFSSKWSVVSPCTCSVRFIRCGKAIFHFWQIFLNLIFRISYLTQLWNRVTLYICMESSRSELYIHI